MSKGDWLMLIAFYFVAATVFIQRCHIRNLHDYCDNVESARQAMDLELDAHCRECRQCCDSLQDQIDKLKAKHAAPAENQSKSGDNDCTPPGAAPNNSSPIAAEGIHRRSGRDAAGVEQ